MVFPGGDQYYFYTPNHGKTYEYEHVWLTPVKEVEPYNIIISFTLYFLR